MSLIEDGQAFVEHVDFSTKQRENLSDKGQAMPGGGFPIRNRADLKRAIQAYGRAKNKAAAKTWIIKRAKALNATDLLPEGWLEQNAEHMTSVEDILEHYGTKGMRWGVRKRRNEKDRAKQFKGGTGSKKSDPLKDLSDKELREILNRMQMEQQYKSLTSGRNGNSRGQDAVRAGASFAAGIATNVARQQITNAVNAQVAKALTARRSK